MTGLIERWCVNTHVWVAAAAASLVAFSAHALGLPQRPGPILLVGSATLLIYRFDGWIDRDRPSHGRWPVVLALAVLLGSAWEAPIAVLAFVGLGAVPCLLYGWPLPRRGVGTPDQTRMHRSRHDSLRAVPGVKPFFVTTALTVATLGVPLLWSPERFVSPAAVGRLAGCLWLLLLCNVTLFDLRDWHADRRRGLATLPVLLGPSRTRRLVIGLMLLLAGVIGWGAPPMTSTRPALLLAALATVLCTVRLKPGSPRLHFALCVDGIPLLLGLVVLISRS